MQRLSRRGRRHVRRVRTNGEGVDMHRHLITTVALLPLLVSGSQGAQRWTFDPAQPMGAASGEFDSGGYLGVEAVNITSERLGELKLKEEQGVEVTMVDQDAPAAKAGVKEHDVILTVNAAAVESKAQLHRMIREIPPGRTVTLGISRDGQPLTVKVQLADSRKTFEDSVVDFEGRREEFPFPDAAVAGFRSAGYRRGVCTFFAAERGDGGEHDAAAGRIFWREERKRCAGAVGGQRQPGGESGAARGGT